MLAFASCEFQPQKSLQNASALERKSNTLKDPEDSSSQSQTTSDPCKGASTQKELNDCAADQFRRSDEELNRVYKRIFGRLESAHRAKLLDAQRAWLRYRDLNCEAERDFRGGSLGPTLQAFCLKSETESRTKELVRIYEDSAGE
jgi:uncharacterized protein YecT (DUF1311 family)